MKSLAFMWMRHGLLMALLCGALSGSGMSQEMADATELPSSPPNPIQLTPQWWQYYNETQTAPLKEKLQISRSFLEQLRKQLRLELQASVLPKIENFLTRLEQTIQLLEESPFPVPDSPASFANAYTIREMMDLLKRLHELEMDVQAQQVDLNQAKKIQDTAAQRIHDLMAAYLDLDDEEQRLTAGLDLMIHRVETEVGQLRLNRQEKQLMQLEANLTNLREERRHAESVLTTHKEEQAALAQLLIQAQKTVEASTLKLARAELQSIPATSNNPLEMAKIRLLIQNTLFDQIEQSRNQLEFEQIAIQQMLGDLLADSNTLEADKVRATIQGWKEKSQSVEEKSQQWLISTRREFNRAGDALVALGNTRSERHLKEIHQQRLKKAQDSLLQLQRLEKTQVLSTMLSTLVQQRWTVHEGQWTESWATARLWMADAFHFVKEWSQKSLFTLGETPVTILGLIRVSLIIVFAFWLSKLIRLSLRRLGENQPNLSNPSLYVLGRLLHYAIIIVGSIIGMSSIGLDFSNLALVAGALSVGIGFGLQSIFNNFVSGLILLFERPLKVGDYVELEGVKGHVQAINVRSTRITTLDNLDILVPNSEFINGKVINWTFRDAYRRIHIPFGVAYGTDKDLVAQAAIEAAQAVYLTVADSSERQPAAWLVNLGDNSLDFELVVWVDPQRLQPGQSIEATYLWEIETALRHYNIEVPFPQRDLHIRSGLVLPSQT